MTRTQYIMHAAVESRIATEGEPERYHELREAEAERTAAHEWDASAALYLATPTSPDGDEGYCAIANRYGEDLAQYVCEAMEAEELTRLAGERRAA